MIEYTNYQEPDIIEHGPQEIKALEQPMLTEEDNCRICLKAENSVENPLLSVCVCKGSVRYVHFICLRKWLNYIMSEKKSSILTSYQWRLFDCELCHKPYPFCVSLGGIKYKLFDIERPEKSNYIILESLTKDKTSSRILHVITPALKPVRLVTSLYREEVMTLT